MHAEVTADIRKRIVWVGKDLYHKGLVKGTSGNISARITNTNTFLIKPSGATIENLKPEELILVDLDGNRISGKRDVSAETPMHAAIYRKRQDVQAVVHTHAPTATAFGIAGKEILPLQIEMFMLLPKGVPIVAFKQPGSNSLAIAVQKKMGDYDAVILENHGIVTIGSSLESACSLNEMVEEAAKIQLSVMFLSGGNVNNLTKLKEKFKTQDTRG